MHKAISIDIVVLIGRGLGVTSWGLSTTQNTAGAIPDKIAIEVNLAFQGLQKKYDDVLMDTRSPEATV